MNKLLIYGLLVMIITGCSPGEKEKTGDSQIAYTCPMHPQVVQEGPGSCPVCHMDLVPVSQAGEEQEIMLSARQIALAGIKVAVLHPGNIGNKTFLSAQLSADQELTRLISSRVPGRIEKLYIKETGQRVAKGQPLYEIYSEELLTLQKEYLLTLEQYRQLGNKHNRYASFMESAKKKLLLYGMNASQVRHLAESGTLSPNITFLAPASGVVTEVSAAEGQYVAQGNPLYKIEGLNQLWAGAELYPREAALVKQGDEVQVIVNGYENEPVKGKVIFMTPEFRTGTQIIMLRAEIPNHQGTFVPGMQASILLSRGSKQTLTLPANAVIRGEDGAHVWVKTGEGTFAPRSVKTGLETFANIEILKGLSEGDSVVTNGAYLLYSELVLKKGS